MEATMIRATIRALRPGLDLAAVVAIERDGFPDPFTAAVFKDLFRRESSFSLAAEYKGKVVGFIIVDRQTWRLDILDLAVAPRWRRMGIGSQLLAEVTKILVLNQKRYQCVITNVRESNLTSQLFLQRNMFRYVKTWVSDEEGDEDHYLFEYKLTNECSGKRAPTIVAAAWVDEMGDVWQGPCDADGPFKWARFDGAGLDGRARWRPDAAERGARWSPMSSEQLAKFLAMHGAKP